MPIKMSAKWKAVLVMVLMTVLVIFFSFHSEKGSLSFLSSHVVFIDAAIDTNGSVSRESVLTEVVTPKPELKPQVKE